MSSVRFVDVRKTFDKVVAVQGLDLSIADGEFVVFVGPSGCGKTTSLRMLAGLEEVSNGQIWLDDSDITRLPAKERDMAMVFQNYALYPHMSVAENIGFALTLRGVPRGQIAERVRKAADMVQIGHLLDRRPRELSGGQKQRVAVCRAIVRDPKVFLFDEPLSNLDPQLRTTARGEIRALQRRLGTTSVYVTHDQIEAMTMADRIVVMADGAVQQIGSPVDLYENPANTFVAAFIGAPPMNIAPMSAADGALRALDRDFGRIGDRLANACKIGVRPESIVFRDDAPSRMSVSQVEIIGAECLVYGEADGASLVARVERAAAPRIGERVGFDWPADATYFFDAVDGRRLHI
ncbi:MAG: sn-glycerol-3-phosphate ABC transporter ATP-binding protein UgpC [Salinarimonadaceae bacterium]|nr:MAG: sn-glycerol-3-phosphate ABC transporter ATP-binding protein UgpC [Salinarimonadaceae bacterium]